MQWRVSPEADNLKKTIVPISAGGLIIALKLSSLLVFGPTFMPDSAGYTLYADKILDGSFLSVDLAGEAIPITLFRSIGFPAVIAGAKIIASANWMWAVVLLQFAASLFATFLVYRLARVLGLGIWASSAVVVAQATTVQFVVDQAILSDSLCGSLMTIATCALGLIVLHRKPTNLQSYLGIGFLIVAAFVMRSVILYMALGLAPLTIGAAVIERSLVKKVVACLFVFLPLAFALFAYSEWNRERVGVQMIASTSQAAVFGALIEANEFDSTIFGSETPFDQAGRAGFAVMMSGKDGYEVVPSEFLHEKFGWSAVRISQEATHAFTEAWLRHPLAMTRHTLHFLNEKQFEQAVRPITTVRDILVWNTGTEHEFAHERAVINGNWWMIPFVILHRASELISVAIFLSFLLITPMRLWREGFSPEAVVSVGLWCSYLMVAGLYATVHLDSRYLTPVLASSIMIGAANIAWVIANYRDRSGRSSAAPETPPA